MVSKEHKMAGASIIAVFLLIAAISFIEMDKEDIIDSNEYAYIETDFGCLKTTSTVQSFEVNKELFGKHTDLDEKRCK